MNPLDRYPSIRAALYMIQWVVNGVLVIAGVVFTALGTSLDALPSWYVLALAIAPVLWTYLGLTAQGNTPSYRDVVEGDAPAPAVGQPILGKAVAGNLPPTKERPGGMRARPEDGDPHR